MKRLLLLTGIVFQFIFIKGQVTINFSDGYIIQNNNDTLFGEIKCFPYSYMSSKIQFKETNILGLKELTPKDLIGFHIQPNTYFEKITINSKEGKDTLTSDYFALKIVSGEIDFLIVYLPNGYEKYFVRSKEFGLAELEQVIEIKENHQLTDNKYLITLSKFMYKHPEFQPKIRDCRFYYKSITNLILDFNSKFASTSLTLPDNKILCDININAGIDYYLGNKIDEKHNTWGMVFGFESSIYQKKNNLKGELIVGLKYRTFHYTEDIILHNIVDTISSIFKYAGNLFEMPVYIKYNNKMRLLSPIIEVGIRPYFIQEKIEIRNFISYKTNYQFAYDFILGVGIGLNYKKLTAKYVIYAEPILQNSFSIGYKIN